MGVLEKMLPIKKREKRGELERVLLRFCSQLGKYARSGTFMGPGGPESSRVPCILAKALQPWLDGLVLIGDLQRRQ